MIVRGMTNAEICDALFADQPKLKLKAEMLKPKIGKQFIKEGRFPSWKWIEYTHQDSRNRYLISFYAPSRNEALNPEVKYIAFSEIDGQKSVVNWGCWPYTPKGSAESIATRHLDIYTRHFFEQYRERVWQGNDMTYNELLCRFFTRNQMMIPLNMNSDIQRKYEDYGEFANVSYQVLDGTCFARSWWEGDEQTIGNKDSDFVSVVLYVTFVPMGMMTETQKKAILKEGTKYIQGFYNSLFSQYQGESPRSPKLLDGNH